MAGKPSPREVAHGSLGPRLVNNHIETYCYAGMHLQDGSTIEAHSGECDRLTIAIEVRDAEHERDRQAGEAAVNVMREALDRLATLSCICGPGCNNQCVPGIARRALAEADRILKDGT